LCRRYLSESFACFYPVLFIVEVDKQMTTKG
jgi:hypothetical protein